MRRRGKRLTVCSLWAALGLLTFACGGAGGGGGGVADSWRLYELGEMPEGATWEGAWDTTWGPLYIERSAEDPNLLVGWYSYENYETDVTGAIVGQTTRNALVLTWEETAGGGGWGHAELYVGPDGESFDGTWGYENDTENGGNWYGTR